MPGLVIEFHLDDHVPGEHLVLTHLPAATPRAPQLLLRGNEDAAQLVAQPQRGGAALDVDLHLVLMTGEGMNDVPLFRHTGSSPCYLATNSLLVITAST